MAKTNNKETFQTFRNSDRSSLDILSQHYLSKYWPKSNVNSVSEDIFLIHETHNLFTISDAVNTLKALDYGRKEALSF